MAETDLTEEHLAREPVEALRRRRRSRWHREVHPLVQAVLQRRTANDLLPTYQDRTPAHRARLGSARLGSERARLDVGLFMFVARLDHG